MKRTAALLLLLAACSHDTIPGTQIPDEPKTRAVLDVFGQYKAALEARDATRSTASQRPATTTRGTR